jgi:hypothetical protein
MTFFIFKIEADKMIIEKVNFSLSNIIKTVELLHREEKKVKLLYKIGSRNQ